MTWYKTGTVNVSNGSPSVTGVGTSWRQQVKQGDIFRGPDRDSYEVLSVNSDSSITLAENYRGPTQSNQQYQIAPTQGFVRDLTKAVQDLIQEYDPSLLPPATTPMLDSDKVIVDQGGATAAATVGVLRNQILKTAPLPAAAATIDDADQFLINQSGDPKRVSAAQMKAAFGGEDLPAGSLDPASLPLAGSDLLVLTQGGSKRRLSVSDLAASIGSGSETALEVQTGDLSVASNNFTVRANAANTPTLTNQAPTGSAAISEHRFYGGSNVDNAPYLRARATASVVDLTSLATGTATAQEFRLGVGSNTQVRMTNTGGLNFRAPASASVTNNEHSFNATANDRMRVSYRDNLGVLRQTELQLLEPGTTWYVSQDERAVFFIGGKDGSDQGVNIQAAAFTADTLGVPLILPPWTVRTRRAFRCNKLVGARGLSWIVAEAPFDASAVFGSEFVITNRNFTQSWNPATAEDVYYLDFGMRIEVAKASIAIAGTKRSRFAGLWLEAVRVVDGNGKAQAVGSLIDFYCLNRNGVVYDCDLINATGAYGATLPIFSPDGGGCIWVRNFRDSSLPLSVLQSTAAPDVAATLAEAEEWVTEKIDIHGNRFVHMTSDEVVSFYGVTGVVRRCRLHDNSILGLPSIGGVHHAHFVTVFPLAFNSGGSLPRLDALGKTAAAYGNDVYNNDIEDHATIYSNLKIGNSVDALNRCFDNKSWNNRVRAVRSNDPVNGVRAVWLAAGSPGPDPDVASAGLLCQDGTFGVAYFSDTSGNTSTDDTVISAGARVMFGGIVGFQRVSNPEIYGNVYVGTASCRSVIGGKIEAAYAPFLNCRTVVGTNYRQNLTGGAVYEISDGQPGVYGMSNTVGESFGSLVRVGGLTPTNTAVTAFQNTVQFLGGASAFPILHNLSPGGATIFARGNTSRGLSASVDGGPGIINRVGGGNDWNGERDDPPRLGGGNTYTGAQTVTPVNLTDEPVLIADAALANTFRVTLGGNRTLANPLNMRDGGMYEWRIQQDSTGGRTLGYGTKFKFPGGSWPTLSTAANAVDWLRCRYNAVADVLECSIEKDFR